MIQITQVEIRYFRSIYRILIKDIRDVAVFSGKNDSGKSNILRALNLFFSKTHTGWNEALLFEKDFCRQRLEECQGRIKSKQFIQVKIWFERGDRYEKSLPAKFWVSRKWNRDSTITIENDNLSDDNLQAKSLDRAKASLQRYLDTIRFEYIPAVKDRSFFNYSLGLLQDAILQSRSNDSLKSAVDGLNETVRNESQLLQKEFKQVAGVDVDVHLPQNLEDLFRAFSVSTGGDNQFPLTVRGDGIQARFLPSLLHHISQRSRKRYIWGFEEPENCLEHSLATKLSEDIIDKYSEQSQILLTSHSPAFIALDNSKAAIYRIYQRESKTEITSMKENNSGLDEDLGLLELQKKYQESIRMQLREVEAAKSIIENHLSAAKMPILLTEGISDKYILEEAWKRIYPNVPMPFTIIPCATNAGDGEYKHAGIGTLKKALEACRQDQPKMIGLFDRDKAGNDAFEKLSKIFTLCDNNPDVKINDANHVAVIRIPLIAGKEIFGETQNLPIEHLSPIDCVLEKIDGRGLPTKKTPIYTVIGDDKKSNGFSDEPHHLIITNNGGKVYWAKTIIPTFTDISFDAFKPMFELVNSVFEVIR